METKQKKHGQKFEAVKFMRKVRNDLTDQYYKDQQQYMEDLKKAMEAFKKDRQKANKKAE